MFSSGRERARESVSLVSNCLFTADNIARSRFKNAPLKITTSSLTSNDLNYHQFVQTLLFFFLLTHFILCFSLVSGKHRTLLNSLKLKRLNELAIEIFPKADKYHNNLLLVINMLSFWSENDFECQNSCALWETHLKIIIPSSEDETRLIDTWREFLSKGKRNEMLEALQAHSYSR